MKQGPEDGAAADYRADYRRARYDVTNQIDTTDPVSVSFEVAQIYERIYKHEFPSGVLRVFADIGRLYRGYFPGYHACETRYHDIQHILEVTLAMARLMDGCARSTNTQIMSEQLFLVGTVAALFHDIGYLRRVGDTEKRHGAEYTRIHVRRSAAFMGWYLPEVGLDELAGPAQRIVHFTGFEGGLVFIDHMQWLESAFLHLSRMDVKPGDRVEAGQVIGAVGATGRATGPHMHWSLKWMGTLVDPQLVAGEMPPTTKSAGGG